MRVQGLGVRIEDLGFTVYGLGFGVWGLGFRVGVYRLLVNLDLSRLFRVLFYGFGFKVHGSRKWLRGLGCRGLQNP